MRIFLHDIERLQPSFIQIAFFKSLHHKIESCWFYAGDKLPGEDAFLICDSRIVEAGGCRGYV